MKRKIFVSYKYYDNDVEQLTNSYLSSRVCDYVDYIESRILNSDYIYKGEKQDEDLSRYSDEYIRRHLKDKIYDSTLTIVLISPNMKEPYRHQKSQWIPWEISYSIQETSRQDRTSHRNAILAVILPNRYGSYAYYNKNNLFPILKENIDNDYIYTVKWNNFLANSSYYINEAYNHRDRTPDYKIRKTLV